MLDQVVESGGFVSFSKYVRSSSQWPGIPSGPSEPNGKEWRESLMEAWHGH